MLFRREKRKVPELNTTATADISFMLLIFFLVTTSMDTDKGLSRQLPPVDDTEEQHPTMVKEGLVMRLEISSGNVLTCDDRPLSINSLRKMVSEHIQRSPKEHIIQLEADRHSSYDTYFKVQNEIVAAYHELRNQQARRRYGKAYALCDDVAQKKLREEIPQRISEVYAEGGEGGEP